MWSYYGSKATMINLYPPPKFGKIREPFAGTARYSLKFFDRDIVIRDKWDVIVNLWKWLQLCSKDDILKLPRLKEGERVSNYKFDCEEAKNLIGFLVGKGLEAPRDKASARATTHRPNHINYSLKRIANNIFKIKHWKIELGSYEDMPNEEATWFLDPPYQFGGHVYKMSNRGWDYSLLSEWAQNRNGQIIVCENTKADWLPFSPMKAYKGSSGWTTEAIWSNMPHDFMARQERLF